MERAVVVGVLGPLEVREGGAPRALGGRRAGRVLGALVARSGSFSSVDVLIDDVWGERPPPSARNSLQSHLSRLRMVLAPLPIRQQRGAYRLVVGPDELDALRFEELCGRARRSAGDRRWRESLEAYERALGLWRGPAFADLLDVVPAMGWATRLEEERLAVVEGAIEARIELGRHGEVVGELGDLVGMHPWREHLWVLWATALYRQGRQVDALGVLDRLRRRLRDELGLRPGLEVERLEVALLRSDPVVAGSVLVPIPTPTPAPAPATEMPADLEGLRGRRMFGRDGVLAQVESCWERSVAGRCAAMFVLGEAGIGKSRLAAELAHRVVADGGVALYGRATERIDLAYQPFAQALRTVGNEAVEAIGEMAGWLSGIVPGVDDEPGPLDADDRRFRLFEAVGRLLGAVAAPGGALLVLDDLHCATAPTLGLLEHLLTVSRPARLMVLGTVRDTDLDAGADIDRFLTEIARRLGGPDPVLVPVVGLGGLETGAVAALMRDHGVDAPDQVDHVRVLTAGNPLLVTELLRAAGDGGDLDAGLRAVGGPGGRRGPAAGVPVSVARLIEARVARLGDRGDDPVTRLMADSSLAVTLYAGPWAARQLALAERMAGRGAELDLVYGARWSAAARLALGDRPGFERDADVLCREGARRSLRALYAYGLQCRAARALLDARFGDAAAIGDEAVAVGRGHENFTRIRLAQQFWSAAEQGQLAAVEPVARTIAADAELPIFAAMLGLVLCATDALGEAEGLLDHLAADGFGRVAHDILRLATLTACAEIAATVGSGAHAPLLDDLLAPYAGQLVVVAGSAFVYGAVDRFRAMLAHLRGDVTTAARCFAAGIELERSIGALPLELRSRWWRLRLLGDAADEAAADDGWSDLAAAGRRLGLGWLDPSPPDTGR